MSEMSNGRISADIYGLSDRVAESEYEIAQLENDIQKLRELIDELKTYWKGSTGEAFTEELIQDLLKLENHVAYFREVSDNFRYAVDIYTRCEDSVCDIIDKII